MTATIERAGQGSATDVLAAIRRFNRFELKYVADRALVEAFRTELPGKLERDPHGVNGFYPLWSTYYD